MNKPSKCIAVATPFGALYLELDGEQYKPSNDNDVLAKLTSFYGGEPLFFYNNDGWVTVVTNGNYSALNIIARYGDSFPQ